MGVGAPSVPAHLQQLHQLMRPLLVPTTSAFGPQTILPSPMVLTSVPGKRDTMVRHFNDVTAFCCLLGTVGALKTCLCFSVDVTECSPVQKNVVYHATLRLMKHIYNPAHFHGPLQFVHASPYGNLPIHLTSYFSFPCLNVDGNDICLSRE